MSGQRKSSPYLGNSILLCLFMSIQLGLCAIPSGSEAELLLRQLEEEGNAGINSHGLMDRELATNWDKPMPVPTSIQCKHQGLVAIPGECAKHFACPRSDMESLIEYCPTNHLFHHTRAKCLQISMQECKDSMCKDTKDKFPHPYAKEKYLTCEKMYPEITLCGDGKVFDKEASYCVEGSPVKDLKSSSEEDNSKEKGNTKEKGNSKDKGNSKEKVGVSGRGFVDEEEEEDPVE